jgi:hypothetical protein
MQITGIAQLLLAIASKEAQMKRIIKLSWLPVVALVTVTTAVFGLARPESAPQPITILDAALYDAEDCRPGPDVEVACPDYTMRIQGKAFTAHIQNECDSQIAGSGIRKCTIAIDMKRIREEWGFRDPSVHHHKSMWVDYECDPGTSVSKRVRAFGSEAADTGRNTPISIICD